MRIGPAAVSLMVELRFKGLPSLLVYKDHYSHMWCWARKPAEAPVATPGPATMGTDGSTVHGPRKATPP